MEPIHEEERDGCKLAIYPDADPMNPLTDYDHAGTVYSWARGFSGDENISEPDLMVDTTTNWEDDPVWEPISLSQYFAEHFDATVVVPLRFSDYGSQGAGLDVCEPEDANAAWAATAKEVASEWFGAGEEDARKYCESFVDEVDAWLHGETYGYVVTDPDGDETDACWGFIDRNVWTGDSEKSHVLHEGRYALDLAVKAAERERTERDRLAGFVETVQ